MLRPRGASPTGGRRASRGPAAGRGAARGPDAPVLDALGPRVSYHAYRAGAEVARRIPEAVGQPAGRAVARMSARWSTAKRAQVERNLRRATGGRLQGRALRRAVSETFDSYGRYWYELFHLRGDLDRAELLADHNMVDGFHRIVEASAAGNGVILALPHIGAWDYAGAWLAVQGYPPTVVVEPVEPPELFEWFVDARRRMGMDVIPLGPEAGGAVLRALRDNRVVCLLADRDIVGDGVEVEFFGETTTLPPGPATLALRTGAPLLPAAVYFRPDRGHHGIVLPPVPAVREGRLRTDVVRVTQELAYRFEVLIREAPEQWHLMQPNWPSDRVDGDATAPVA
ncbi:MAG TPA: phosphatidylinositol mannoside acyltransferase [Acidimicrobiia bacterium]